MTAIVNSANDALAGRGPLTLDSSTGIASKDKLGSTSTSLKQSQQRNSRRRNNDDVDDPSKRRCVSTACIACRKRKSKCDGNTPACAACSQVYNTECIYDPNSDHRRKGVYKNDIDNLKTRNSTLQTLIQAILNYAEDDVPALVREIRTCESLDAVAERIMARESGADADDDDGDEAITPDPDARLWGQNSFESHLFGKMGDLRLNQGSTRYIGGTSNLIHIVDEHTPIVTEDDYLPHESPVTSWTRVTSNVDLVHHLLNMYFTWHYTFFTTLSKPLFYRDFNLGVPPPGVRRQSHYCSPLLVNAILALGCHFTSHAGAREDPNDPATAGDHFFREAKRLILENDEHETPHLTTVQALALMSVREAGCGREGKGWVYSGMSFRMACDMGLNLDSGQLTANKSISGDEHEDDVRRLTFWGCYLFDKCWSNYLGRMPQLPTSIVTVSKYDVFPDEEASQWSPYNDSGFSQAHAQPSRTRTVSLQLLKLCEISNDLMKNFYNPIDMEKTKGKAAELKKLSDIHTRLETWRRELPKELEPREGCLSSVLVMHMYFQILFIHLFRPFLKYTAATSPLPSSVSPRKLCTQAAAMISKLMRLYKRSHGLRQICNIAIYIVHSACTIHLLNLPDKNAKRDIVHGAKHLEEIAECWLGARRTLAVLSALARKWQVELPEEAAAVFERTDSKFGPFSGEFSTPSPVPRRDSEVTGGLESADCNSVWPVESESMVSEMGPSNPASVATKPKSAPYDAQQQVPRQLAHDTQGTHHISQLPSSIASLNGRTTDWPIDSGNRSGTSPSEMFGGVEQLLRDSHAWTYKDQQQLAMGFGNWNSTDDAPTASRWADASYSVHPDMQNTTSRKSSITPRLPVGIIAVPQGLAARMRVDEQPNISATHPASAMHPAYDVATDHVHPSGNDYANGALAHFQGANSDLVPGASTWLNSMHAYNTMAGTYNEDEWYE